MRVSKACGIEFLVGFTRHTILVLSLFKELNWVWKWGNIGVRLLLGWTEEEKPTPKAFIGEPEVHHMSHGDEGNRDDHEKAEGLGIRREDDHDEVQEIEKIVHRVLHAVDDSSLRLDHVLLDQLSHGQVERPKTWKQENESSHVKIYSGAWLSQRLALQLIKRIRYYLLPLVIINEKEKIKPSMSFPVGCSFTYRL